MCLLSKLRCCSPGRFEYVFSGRYNMKLNLFEISGFLKQRGKHSSPAVFPCIGVETHVHEHVIQDEFSWLQDLKCAVSLFHTVLQHVILLAIPLSQGFLWPSEICETVTPRTKISQVVPELLTYRIVLSQHSAACKREQTSRRFQLRLFVRICYLRGGGGGGGGRGNRVHQYMCI